MSLHLNPVDFWLFLMIYARVPVESTFKVALHSKNLFTSVLQLHGNHLLGGSSLLTRQIPVYKNQSAAAGSSKVSNTLGMKWNTACEPRLWFKMLNLRL